MQLYRKSKKIFRWINRWLLSSRRERKLRLIVAKDHFVSMLFKLNMISLDQYYEYSLHFLNDITDC